ncbi:hypothetical protein [Aquimarina latercula]|uniref:hypothetical protein n=1 Tax=Aquimarina latercula TaxID=987 RepID=UPI0003F52A92|nr:hypothetical protein [Aquimarina latercula]
MDYKRENSIFKIKYRLDPEQDIDNCNTDIFVTIVKTQKVYLATFYTYKNITSLVEKFKKSGECLSGYYFWDEDMCLIDDMSIDTLDKVIFEIIENEEFFSIFSLVETEWLFPLEEE